MTAPIRLSRWRSRARADRQSTRARHSRRATSRWRSTRSRLQAAFAAQTTRNSISSSPTCRWPAFDATIRGVRPPGAPPRGAASLSTWPATWRWSSSCWRCGSPSASPQAPGTSGRSGPSSAPGSGSSDTRYRFDSRCSVRATPSRLDQPGTDRIAGQGKSVAQAQLGQRIRTMPVDRLGADAKGRGDLTSRITLGDQLEHLFLTRREDGVWQRIALPRAVQVVANQARSPRRRRGTARHATSPGTPRAGRGRRPI